ncbi:MAG: mucoidy inhibitor MuiA family protein [Planctomycetota bacterium]|nr:mucoidy inhibitor MuiA family protein [Planctomycetota bacterium]
MIRSAFQRGLFLLASSMFVDAAVLHAGQEVESSISSVLLYRGGADVERVATLDLEEGVHELVFSGIPDPGGEGLEGVRASASGPWKVVGVDIVRRRIPLGEMQDADDLEGSLAEARDLLRGLELRRKGVEADLDFLEAVRIRAAADATDAGGTRGLDLDVVRSQLEFVQQERESLQARLLEVEGAVAAAERGVESLEQAIQRRGSTREEVVARVRVAVTEGGSGDVAIRYLRSRASWRPTYSIRSTRGIETMPIEYEAIVAQSTGEDWNDVDVVLSTAVPTRPSGPPEISPVYVDRREGPGGVAFDVDSMALGSEALPDLVPTDARRKLAAIDAIKDATVDPGGTAVTFSLPGPVSIASDDRSTTRLRLADFVAPAERVLVARPVADESVFLRVDLENQSPFVLLRGTVDLFMQGEYIGTTRIDEVPAGGGFEVWFGPDPSISVVREVVSRNTERTGLLGGGRQTSIDYRIDLRNAGADPVMLELWDRRPVSRDGDIEVRVVDVSPALATDEAYLDLAARQGLLKWVVDLGAAGSETSGRAVSWTVRVNRSSDLDITPIPE